MTTINGLLFSRCIISLTELNKLIVYNILVYYNSIKKKKKTECRNRKFWEEVMTIVWIVLKLGPGLEKHQASLEQRQKWYFVNKSEPQKFP